jgi:hypothetical protein
MCGCQIPAFSMPQLASHCRKGDVTRDSLDDRATVFLNSRPSRFPPAALAGAENSMMSDAFQQREDISAMPISLSDVQQISLRHLKDPAGDSVVQRLRQEIDLAVHARMNPYFHLEEKKETKSAFRSPSSSMVE